MPYATDRAGGGRDGNSRATASKCVNRYKQFAELGLIDGSSAPARQPTATPGRLVERSRCGASAARPGHALPDWLGPLLPDFMTVADVYHYATQHYRHHRRQLTLARVAPAEAN